MTDQMITPEDARRHAAVRRHRNANVGTAERAVCTAAGGALIGWGLRRRGVVGGAATAVGTALAWHGCKPHSHVYAALGITGDDASTWSHPLAREAHSRAVVTVQRDAEELHRAWLEPDRLALLFPRVRSVDRLGDGRTRWTVGLPDGQTFEWTARVEEDRPGRAIRWRSEPGSPFDHRGVITFGPGHGGRGTVVTLEMRYKLPAGAIGVVLAKLQDADPKHQAAEALRRFKQWAETGEITSNAGPTARGDGHTRGSIRQAVVPDERPGGGVDRVEAASMESFPASDPPAHTGTAATPSARH